jgi:hypothetical protein
MLEPVRDYELRAFFSYVIEVLERLEIPYEDIIIAKLIAYRETGSDKHLRDARGVLVAQEDDLDLEFVRRNASANQVLEAFEEILRTIRRDSGQPES